MSRGTAQKGLFKAIYCATLRHECVQSVQWAQKTRADRDAAEAVMYRALSRGLSFKLTMGNILLLVPALTITQDEMARALEILERCIAEVEADHADQSQ